MHLVFQVQIDKERKPKDHWQKNQWANSIDFDANAQTVSGDW
jgi:hypothetical protein